MQRKHISPSHPGLFRGAARLRKLFSACVKQIKISACSLVSKAEIKRGPGSFPSQACASWAVSSLSTHAGAGPGGCLGIWGDSGAERREGDTPKVGSLGNVERTEGMFCFAFYLFLWFGSAAPSGVQCLSLTQHSGIMPGGALRTCRTWGLNLGQLWINRVLSLAPREISSL